MIPQQDLQPLLRAPYDRRAWTAMLRRLFPGLEAFEKPQRREVEDFNADEILQIGSIRLADDRRIAVLEVRIGRQVKLLRNRVGLRNLVASFIDQQAAHGVLAVFRSHEPAFRLTFASRSSDLDTDGHLVRRETAPRRYTFVLGPGESCRTAAERLERLSARGDAATLADVAEAFSVEKLNREFFDRYRAHYDRFVAHTLGAPDTAAVFGLPRRFATPDQKDKALKPVRDFVKKLLGRLVFLHFLQKKGWLGCPAGRSDWTGGDPDFLQTWYGRTRGHDRFYRSFLVPLFYDALNRADRPDDLFEPAGSRVPYLNGGLFERESLPVEDLDLPDALFGELLDFLGQYNFTVDENDPEDHEIGIDPEMLGHIFENLLEDNKDKGAFYTPKAIVQYMGQQSLLHHLQTHLAPSTDEQRAALEALVRHKDAGDPKDKANWIRSNAREIERLLDDVKICDPAIGSGAFPIGLLQEIFWIKLTLDWTLDGAETKRKIIQNSIYGVDIDAGAVEIARLRCWLALVVEEDRPRPLPNLDYKIMQGDSLLESFEGIPLDRLHGPPAGTSVQSSFAEFGAPAQDSLPLTSERAADLRRMTDTYFESYDPAEKARLHTAIDRLVLDHLEYNIQQKLDDLSERIARAKTSFARKLAALKKDQRAAYSRTAKEKTVIARLEREYQETLLKKDKLKALAATHERPYFLWHLFFQDVFARGGFDIVIANPPYVSSEQFSRTGVQASWKIGYPNTFAPRVDIYCLFFELGLKQLLRRAGFLCFISSNKYLRTSYGKGLRHLITHSTRIFALVDFGELPVFAAGTDPAIVLVQNTTPTTEWSLSAAVIKSKEDLLDLDGSVERRRQSFQQSVLSDDGWTLESPRAVTLLAKLHRNGTELGRLAEGRFYRGIITGFNDAFVLDQTARAEIIQQDARSEELIKPWLQGREIKRWKGDPSGLHVIVVRYGFHSELHRYPAILKHLTKYRRQLTDRGQCRTSRDGALGGQHHWLELDNNPTSEYLALFEKPKIVFNETSKELHAFVDYDNLFINKTGFIVQPDDPEYVLSILNSTALDWLYRMEFPSWGDPWKGGRIQFRGERMAKVPIPTADDTTRSKLRALARRAAKAAGAELAAIEREIDGIVYRLFDLTSDEIAIIEQAAGGAKAGLDNKTALFTRVLPGLKERAPYFSLDVVRHRLAEIQLSVPAGLLWQYMSEAEAEGIVHDAGRGWYSGLATRAELDPKPVRNLIRLLEKEFPLLDYTVWSSQQVNPWMHHVMAKFIDFVQVDKDGISAVAECLRDRGYDVHENPTAAAAGKVLARDNTVVVRPLHTHAPRDGHKSPPEAVLVDLSFEVERLNLMDAREFREMASRFARSGRLALGALLQYASKRGIEPSGLFIETDEVMAEQ